MPIYQKKKNQAILEIYLQQTQTLLITEGSELFRTLLTAHTEIFKLSKVEESEKPLKSLLGLFLFLNR